MIIKTKEFMQVPIMDLSKQYQNLRSDIDKAIAGVINKSAFIRGPFVDAFESEFADAMQMTHCLSCANGTDAIYIALKSLDVRPGDEVIVPAMSWISTSETVSQAGGQVVFCDIDPISYTLCPSDLRKKITDKTVGIIPVHLYGHPAAMHEIKAIADSQELWIIEDCAQAHMATIDDQLVGTWSAAATYSFYPGKNLGAMGDAGAVLTENLELLQRMTKFARHGGLVKGEHEIEGINSRLDGMQAAILSVKLRHLKDWTKKRRDLAAGYTEALKHCKELVVPKEVHGCGSAWHLYVIKTSERQELLAYLKTHGIQTGINYPRELPSLPCYEYLGHRASDFPVANELATTCLSLPLFPEMEAAEQAYVVQHDYKYFEQK
mgnify:CR=1 FL=1